MKISGILVITIALSAFSALPAGGEVYKHVDENGRVRYSNEPISGGKKLTPAPLPDVPPNKTPPKKKTLSKQEQLEKTKKETESGLLGSSTQAAPQMDDFTKSILIESGILEKPEGWKPYAPAKTSDDFGKIDKPAKVYQAEPNSPPQQDNSHTLAWGAGVAVFVAVALLAWFKFKKTETSTGAGAAQLPIHERQEKCYAENEPHNLQVDATKGNAMSQNQKGILMAVLAIVTAMFIYPPFQVINNNGMAFNMGYGWIFDSPKRGSMVANVNVPMLLIQWVGVLIVGGIAFFLAKSSPQELRVAGSTTKNENPSHAQPDPMLGTKLEKLQSAKKLFFIALAIDITVTVIAISGSVWALGALKDINSGARTLDQSLASSIDFWSSFSWVMILTTISVGIGLVNWLSSCYQFAKGSLHATGFTQEWWIGTGWIFPIFNLFKPYQVINEIYRAGSPTYNSGDDWKKESGSGLILTWWIFWAVTHFLMVTIGREIFKKTFLNDLTVPQIIGIYEVQAWSCAISIVVAGLWFVVANHLTLRLVDRSSRYAPKPGFSASAHQHVIYPVTVTKEHGMSTNNGGSPEEPYSGPQI